VPTKKETSFDTIEVSQNVGISPNSASHEKYHILIPQGGQLLCNHKLTVKVTSSRLIKKLSIIKKDEIQDEIFNPKN
jgi:hypothetical protein